jgi:exonuclease III
MGELVVASLNTRGVPVRGSRLVERYTAMAATFEASSVDVVTFQEVHTYVHLRLLARGMPSFRSVTYRRGPLGPAGGVVTMTRRPGRLEQFQRFPLPAAVPGLSQRARWLSPVKGTLVIRLTDPDVLILNTHPTANPQGDWSNGSSYAPMHRQQLATLATLVQSLPAPVVLCGDFNIARDSDLHRDFMAGTQLKDAFGGHCPPTFHAEYLPAGRSAQCIDFVLVSASIVTEATQLMFTAEQSLPSGGRALLSDHLGLRATLCWS